MKRIKRYRFYGGRMQHTALGDYVKFEDVVGDLAELGHLRAWRESLYRAGGIVEERDALREALAELLDRVEENIIIVGFDEDDAYLFNASVDKAKRAFARPLSTPKKGEE